MPKYTQDEWFEIQKKHIYDFAKEKGWTRFCVIAYMCQFTDVHGRYERIDHYRMAAEMIRAGIKVLYNDSSISKEENQKQERKVNKILKSLEANNE